jgi:hypothetical protein
MSTPAATTTESVGKNVHPAPSTEVSTAKRRKLSSTAWTAEPVESQQQLVASGAGSEEEEVVDDDVLAVSYLPISPPFVNASRRENAQHYAQQPPPAPT